MFFFNLCIALRKNNILPSLLCLLPQKNHPALQICLRGFSVMCWCRFLLHFKGLVSLPSSPSGCQPWRLLPTPLQLLIKESGSPGPSAYLDPFPSPEESWKLGPLSTWFLPDTLSSSGFRRERTRSEHSSFCVGISVRCFGRTPARHGRALWYYLTGG